MADSLIVYEMVKGSFKSLVGLLFWVLYKYYKMRSPKYRVDAKAKLNWMKRVL